MKDLKPLFLTALFANLITILLYIYAANQPGGNGIPLVISAFLIPALWLITLIITVVIAVKRRNLIFKRIILRWTIFCLIFCTPVPLNITYFLTHYWNTYLASTSYRPENGITIKEENWAYYSNGKTAVHKFYKLMTENYTSVDDEKFEKDSIWSYLNRKGDTTKIEKYKNGELTFSKDIKRHPP